MSWRPLLWNCITNFNSLGRLLCKVHTRCKCRDATEDLALHILHRIVNSAFFSCLFCRISYIGDISTSKCTRKMCNTLFVYMIWMLNFLRRSNIFANLAYFHFRIFTWHFSFSSGSCHTYGGGSWPSGEHCCHCGSQVGFYSFYEHCMHFHSLWDSQTRGKYKNQNL